MSQSADTAMKYSNSPLELPAAATTAASTASAKAKSIASQADLLLEGSDGRSEVERFIADRYLQVHHAHVTEFLPILIQISQEDTASGAFGLRPGRYKPMFLEQYLDSSIEQQVANFSHQPVDRYSLMEVGNLVVTRNGFGPLMLVILAMSLAEAGYSWMVFTVTEQVERLMKRLGFTPHYLVSANPDRLTADKSMWGTYYDNNPKVMIGSLAEAASIIQSNPKLQAIAQQHQSQISDISRSLSDYRRLAGE